MKAGQVGLTREHAVEFGADLAPSALDLARPGEYRLVVDRRIADFAQAHVKPLGESHDAHENVRDQAWPSHRFDAVGAETLCGVLIAGN